MRTSVFEKIKSNCRLLNNKLKTAGDIMLVKNKIPIVNENDSVATEEISFGDNDTLAGMITGLVDASRFVMLTDQIGICTSNPNINQSAKLVSEINLDKDDLDFLNNYYNEDIKLYSRIPIGGIKLLKD